MDIPAIKAVSYFFNVLLFLREFSAEGIHWKKTNVFKEVLRTKDK